MEEITVENNLDKECSALGGLFQHIVDETKAGIPSIEELIVKAGKLNSSLKGATASLGSFLDTFQKIADAASNTKGGSRDIGTCLTRIVIRHRALESRMKTLSGALMDCLVLPIQNKLEEWKKITHALDKEHAKEYKRYRSYIKKKSDQVLRLRKKAKKDVRGSSCSLTDPSVQRLIEQTSRDLNNHYKQLSDHEKKCLRRILTEERHRYCNLVASLKPIIDEELGMLSELASVEDVMQKLGNVTTNPDEYLITDQFIDDAAQGGGPLVYATPPTTPSPSMGSRKSSMCSIASISSSTSMSQQQQPLSPSRSSTTSSLRRHTSYRISYNGSDNGSTTMMDPSLNSRPSSALSASVAPVALNNKNGCWMDEKTKRPHTINGSNGSMHQRPGLNGHTFMPTNSNNLQEHQPNSEPVSPAKFSAGTCQDLSTYSTIRRSYRSPFRTSGSGYNGPNVTASGRPPLPARCSSADRSSSGSLISMHRSTSVERSLVATNGKPPGLPANSVAHSNSVHVIGFHNSNSSSNTNGSLINGNASSNDAHAKVSLVGPAGSGAAAANADKNSNIAMVSPTHYAVPKANAIGASGPATKIRIQLVPDFHQGKHDMVIPQPVYMNSEELEKLRQQKAASEEKIDELPDDDLKTPTIEELTFPGHHRVLAEDGSSSSSGSSSGYGSQNAIKIEDKNPPPPGLSHSQRIDCCTTMSNNNYQHHFSTSKLQLLNSLHSASSANADSPTTNRNNLVLTSSNLSRRPSFTLQSPLQHRPIVENIILSDNNNTYRQNNHFPDPFNFNQSSRSRANAFSSLRRSDSYSPGMPPPSVAAAPSPSPSGGSSNQKMSPSRAFFHRSVSHNSSWAKPPPPPPIRRSSSITSQDSTCRTSTFRTTASASNDDEDVTPHGSVENVSISPPPPPAPSCQQTTTGVGCSGLPGSSSQDRLSLEAMVAKASSVASNLIQLDNNHSNNNTMRRSTSLSTKSTVPEHVQLTRIPTAGQLPPPPAGQQLPPPSFDREGFLRRSLTLTSKADRANLIHSLTERISQRMNNAAVQPPTARVVSTHHVIPVNKQVMSPEGEKYGFGVKFKESSNQYYDMSQSYPNPMNAMNVENQKFIDSLRTNLLKQETNPNTNTTVTTSSLNPAENQLHSQLQGQNPSRNQLNNEIQNGTFHLKKTNGIHHDQSAPKL